MESCLCGSFASIRGMIVNLDSARSGNPQMDGCVLIATIEDENGNTVTFLITPDTFVVDHVTLGVGQKCEFWYRTDAPMPLIYPPQYTAVVAAEERSDRFVDVSFYNDSLVNEEQTLQLRLDGSVKLRTVNNQYFQGNPANHDLVVTYETSTRSIPAQTTPKEVVVLCGNMPE